MEIKKFNNYKIKWNINSETMIKPGLERIKKALHLLGNPQHKHKIIHVAGTNGKGSTIAFMREIASEHGIKYGSFTSPCLIDVHDQILLNGNHVTEAQMDHAFSLLVDVGISGLLTDFELLTVIAFLVFAEQELDVVFIEAGMGGRFDSTNVINHSVAVIPSISIDHTNFLGETIEEISWHKAGITKEHGKLILGETSQAAKEVICKEVADKNADLIEITKHFKITDNSYNYKNYIFEQLYPQMLGEHQLSNMALAITAMIESGFILKEEKVKIAINNASLPGRMEKWNDHVYMDGAHNRASIDALVETIKKYFSNERIHFIIGILRDKDYKYILDRLEEVATSFEFVDFEHERALDATILFNHCTNSDKSVTKDIHLIDLHRSKKESVTIVSGSLYLITELKGINS
ncbi:MAG: folylpolyglutamate synthase/dihydrofolate synthase family protein [Psychrobacillus sp.]